MSRRTGDDSSKWRKDFAARLPLPCSICGKPVVPGTPWDVDHLLPYAQGGRAVLSNVWPAHRHCNQSAGQALGQARIRARKNANTDTGLRPW